MSSDTTETIQQQVEQALKQHQKLSIHGSGSHDFMLPDYREDQALDMTRHCGILDYQPTELNLKARSGTLITEIQQTLQESHQRLATDFPVYAPNATLGGALCIAHSGSGRPFLGAIRDHVLGATLINGSAERLSCGGQVMKNVAGYDISRLLAGSRGTLGPILDITVKVLPIPESSQTVVLDSDENQSIQTMNALAGRSLPVTAGVYHQQKLYVRLEGTESGVQQARATLGGESLNDSAGFWRSIQQQSHSFFKATQPGWRIVVPTTTPELPLEHGQQTLIDWCGGLRWVHADEITPSDLALINKLGGYIESHRGGLATDPAGLMTTHQKSLHHKIKMAFDPQGLFNPKLCIQ